MTDPLKGAQQLELLLHFYGSVTRGGLCVGLVLSLA